jgi:hypothetical protein
MAQEQVEGAFCSYVVLQSTGTTGIGLELTLRGQEKGGALTMAELVCWVVSVAVTPGRQLLAGNIPLSD